MSNATATAEEGATDGAVSNYGQRVSAAEDADDLVVEQDRRRTGRWRGIVAVALFAGAVGVLAARPFLLLATVPVAAFAAYPRLTGSPKPTLAVERTVDDDTPDRGADVEVTVRITNTGRWPLSDVRFVDGVPPMLAVRDGSPRHATFLWPGSTTEFSYTVGAEYGRHQFDPVTAMLRDVSGGTELEATVESDPATVLTCTDAVPEVPLRKQSRHSTGRLVTDDGGAGIEFHRTREYQKGDPMSRIDWKRYAKTGELTTVEFREERAATIVLLIDARQSAYRASAEGEPHGMAYNLAGAEQLLTALGETRDYVGLAAIGRQFCWLAAGVGIEHEVTARELLATHPVLSTVPPDEEPPDPDEQAAELRKRLSGDAQVILLSPLGDEYITSLALTLEANGHPVTVVSPNVSSDASVGARLASVDRENRVSSLRQAEIPVIDWTPDQPLGTSIVDVMEVEQ
ncbi:DUF58 domain-containing protein [Halomarina oriensis]|uniref:DUF58 domain-containing protein n=1 Tax=Halomarina oriensis TaxID=671145 RepID=A0A6B0GKA4_9EURY|nr:DUF58 domain-containing protein [Halomarina oriensis]MWG33223.1 DUF58 domain-containing protein [Halomarina oriensis]